MFQDARERTVAIGVWIGAFSAGSAVGPILGGIMLEFFWWGSVFLIAIPVMVALLILGPRILPESRDPEAGRLDPASAIMAVGAVLAVIFGLKQIAQEGPGLLAIGAVVVGLVIGALWVRRQRQLADPMIDLALFRVPTFNAALVVNFLAIFVVVGYFLFIAQYLQLVARPDAIPGGPAVAALRDRFHRRLASGSPDRPARQAGIPHQRWAGLRLVGPLPADPGRHDERAAPLVVASVVISLGLAPVFGLTTELIVGSAPPERAGAASGISETGAELGGALGIAILGSVGAALYRGGLPRPSSRASAGRRDRRQGHSRRAVGVASTLPVGTADTLLAVARAAFVDGMHVAAAIAGVIGLGLAAFAYVTLRDRGTERSATDPVCVEPTMIDQPG